MVNKYLMKIATQVNENGRPSANKTFLSSTLASWGGHIGGAALGAAGLGYLAAKNKRVGQLSERTLQGAKALTSKFKNTSLGQFATKNMTKAGPAAAVGAVAGGFAGEELANYAAIRHGMKVKKNDQ